MNEYIQSEGLLKLFVDLDELLTTTKGTNGSGTAPQINRSWNIRPKSKNKS